MRMEKIIKHGAEQIKKHIGPGWARNDPLLQQALELEKQEQWPFKSITPDDFRKTIIALGELAEDIHNEKFQLTKTSPGVLHDRVAYRTSDLIQCIHRMEKEAQNQAILSRRVNMGWADANSIVGATQMHMLFVDREQRKYFPQLWGMSVSPQQRERAEMAAAHARATAPMSKEAQLMLDIVRNAKEALYKHNNNALDLLQEMYMYSDIKPIRVSTENEKRYTPNLAIAHTQRVTKEHEEAFAAFVKGLDNIFKHGLPNESSVGKLMETLFKNVAEIREQNEGLFKNLLSAEMDIETIENFIIPQLWLRSFEMEAYAAVETIGCFDVGMNGYESSRTGPHIVYREAIKQIEQMIKEMREREAKMMPSVTLSMSRDKDGIYTISITRARGDRTEVQFQQDESQHKKTVDKGRAEKTRVFKLGKMSHQLMEEKKLYTAKIYGKKEEISTPTHNPKKHNEQIKIVKENVYGEISLGTTRTTTYHGKRSSRVQLKADIARIDRLMNKTHQEGRQKKEVDIVGAKTSIGGASITTSMPTRDTWGTPKISAEAHPVKVDANYRKLNASFSAGPKFSVGVQLSPEDISKNAAKALIEEMSKGSSANFVRVIDDMMAMIKNAGPSASMNWTNISVTAAAMEILDTQVTVERQEETQAVDTFITVGSPIVQDVQHDLEIGAGYYNQIQVAAEYLDDQFQAGFQEVNIADADEDHTLVDEAVEEEVEWDDEEWIRR